MERLWKSLKLVDFQASTLILDNNEIGLEGAKFLSKILSEHDVIEHLSLKENDLGAMSVQIIAQAIRERHEEGMKPIKTLEFVLPLIFLSNSSFFLTHLSILSHLSFPLIFLSNSTHSLSFNPLGISGAKHIATEILEPNLPLQSLTLMGCEVGAQGTRWLADALKGNTHLELLDLNKNSVEEGVQYLGSMLSANNHLKSLTLAFMNSITDEGLKSLVEGLRENEQLALLDLRDNEIGVDGARELADLLRFSPPLIHLFLSENRDIKTEGAIELFNALVSNDVLETLHLSSCRISPDAGPAIYGALTHFPQEGEVASLSVLKELDLSFNSLGSKGGEMIGKGLRRNKALVFLNLNANRLGPVGAHKLSYGLYTINKLLTTSPSGHHTRVSDKKLEKVKHDKEYLRSYFNEDSKLIELYLEMNDIQDKGFKSLSKALLKNDKVQILSVSESNKITDESSPYLINLLSCPECHIHMVSIQNNLLEKASTCNDALSAIQTNPELLHFDMEGNPCYDKNEEDVQQELAKALKQNKFFAHSHHLFDEQVRGKEKRRRRE